VEGQAAFRCKDGPCQQSALQRMADAASSGEAGQ
jgi:hypothetical protein